MIGEYDLREWEVTHWSPIIEKEIVRLDRGGKTSYSLTGKNLCPRNLLKILDNLGWSDDDYEFHNGEMFITCSHPDRDYELSIFVDTFLFNMEVSKIAEE